MQIIMLAAAIKTARAINMFDLHGIIILDRLSLAPSRSASLEQLFEHEESCSRSLVLELMPRLGFDNSIV